MNRGGKKLLLMTLAAFLLPFFTNCSTSPPRPSETLPVEQERKSTEELEIPGEEVTADEDEKNILFSRIEKEYESNNLALVERLLEEYAERFGEAEQNSRLLFLRGSFHFDQQNYEKAASSYLPLIKNFLDFSSREEALLRLGLSYLYLDEWDESIETFEVLLTSITLAADLTFTANRHYAQALINKARFTDAISAYKNAYLVDLPLEKKSILEFEIRNLIENLINWEDDLETTAEILKGLPGEPEALFKLAKIKFDNEDYTAAFFLVKRVIADFPAYEYISEAELFLAEVNRNRGHQVIKIGCFVPLTGPLSPIGRKILNGLQIAFAEVSRDEGIKLIVKDSNSGGEKLLRAAQGFSEDPSVLAVIGPTFSEEIETVMETAEGSGLVLFTPTAASPNLEGVSPYLLRNSLTSKSEAYFMAKVAIDYLGISSLAILYQDDAYGTGFKNFFKEKIAELDGEITKEVSFKTNESDFGSQIRAIGGMSDGRISKILKEGSPLKDFRYDGIYIAGDAETVSLLLPQLAYYNINDIPILGNSSLDSDEIIKSGNIYSEKLIFPSGFYTKSEENAVKNFTGKYQIYFNEEPDTVSAQAYDTAQILLHLIRKGYLTREALRKGISTLKNYEGITGVISMAPSGDAEREFQLLSMRNGKIVEVSLRDL